MPLSLSRPSACQLTAKNTSLHPPWFALLPCAGLVTAVCRALTRCRVHVLIRPRPGDFLYSPQELQASQTDAQPLAHAQPCNRSPPCVRELCRRSREPQAAGGDVQHLSLLCSHALGSVLTARPPSPPNSAEPPCQQVMRSDVLHAASCGAHGVVLGMLTPGGEADVHALRPFVELCAALGEAPLETGPSPNRSHLHNQRSIADCSALPCPALQCPAQPCRAAPCRAASYRAMPLDPPPFHSRPGPQII